METTNYYESNPKANKEPKDNRILIYSLLSAALLITLGYLIYDKNKSGESIKKLATENSTVISERDLVRDQYNTSLARLDSLTGVNQGLVDSLSTSGGSIVNLRSEIRRILQNNKATSADLSRARKMIGELNGKIESLGVQVTQLQTENQTLVETNTRIIAEKDQVVAELETTKTEKSAIQRNLEETADVASTLAVSNINIEAVNEKVSGKEKETVRARRADKLRINFDLEPNRLAKAGEKEIYIAVTAPDGTSLSAQETIQTREEGEKQITAKMMVPYDGGKKSPVSFDWRSENKFQMGNYKIEIFHNGFKIGEGIRTLKS